MDKLEIAREEYPEFFEMDREELESRIDSLIRELPDDDHARNWDGFEELEALEIALEHLAD